MPGIPTYSQPFPNILQYSRFNDTRDREKKFLPNLSSDEFEIAVKRCLENGFIEKDASIQFDLLKRKTLDRLEFSFSDKDPNFRIHPLTFVIFNEQNYILTPTNQLLDDPLKVIKEVTTIR